MAQRSLESLGVPEPVLRKLRALGVETPASLRSMIAAAPDDLRYVGPEAFAVVTRVLESFPEDTPETGFEQERIVHGAQLETPPFPKPPEVDLALRDRLFAELQQLLKSGDERSLERVRELEARLDAMLER
jgi:hypothetical protein